MLVTGCSKRYITHHPHGVMRAHPGSNQRPFATSSCTKEDHPLVGPSENGDLPRAEGLMSTRFATWIMDGLPNTQRHYRHLYPGYGAGKKHTDTSATVPADNRANPRFPGGTSLLPEDPVFHKSLNWVRFRRIIPYLLPLVDCVNDRQSYSGTLRENKLAEAASDISSVR